MTMFLLATVADRTVAIPVDQVESVVDLGPVVPVPGAPPYIWGLAALRSKLLTVISSRLLLGAERQAPKRAVIMTVDGHGYAILVSQLEDVAEFKAAALPPGLLLSGAWRTVASGVVDHRGEPVLVIDLRALVSMTAAA